MHDTQKSDTWFLRTVEPVELIVDAPGFGSSVIASEELLQVKKLIAFSQG